jgi:hypothetical protein
MKGHVAGRGAENRRTLLLILLVAGVLFFGSVLFIVSRAPHF